MNSKLNEKLLWLKAKKYISNLDGITNVSMDVANDLTFEWHKSVLLKIWSERESPNHKISLSVNICDIIKYISHEVKLSRNVCAHILYEGQLLISFIVVEPERFLLSNFEWNKTYDISLLFLNPNRVIVISENEYDLTIYNVSDGE